MMVGIDVSKGYADFAPLDSDGRPAEKTFQLPDTSEGHKNLRAWLKKSHATKGYERIVLVAESTGGYEDNWMRSARHQDVAAFCAAFRINPKIIHHEYKVQQRNSITDGVSALTIATYAFKNPDRFKPRAVENNEDLTAARGILKHLAMLEKSMVMHKNALEKTLYRYLPSLLALKSEGWSIYFLQILIKYGSRKAIQKAAARGFKTTSRVPKGFAEKVASALKDGHDQQDTPALTVLQIQAEAREILRLELARVELKRQLAQHAPVDAKHVELLCSIKGMGKDVAVALLCYIGQIERFENAAQIAAFFGVVPRIKQSGDNPGKAHLSKQGNPAVRKELYLLAFRVISTEPYLKAIYERKRKQGMTHDGALGLLMHKLIRIIFGMLKTGKEFNAGIDQLNQTKQGLKPSQTTPDPKDAAEERQDLLKAPISAIKRKKIKKDYESQAATVAECAGSS